MALHSVYGASAPPGTYAWYTDGTPSIRTAAGFYRSASGTAVQRVAGARLWVTAACLAANSSATVRLYTTGTDMSLSAAQTALGGTPLQTVTLPIVSTGWNEVSFASPVSAAVSQRFYIEVFYDGVGSGYQHSGNLTGAGAPADGSIFTAATGGWGFVLASGSEYRAMYRIGTGTPSVTTNAALYGIDILMDDSTGTDTTAPSVPTGLTASTVGYNSATLTWTASTDDTAVTGYEVFLGGVSQGTPSGTSFNLTGLTPSTAYTATVRARDAAGNWSAQTSSVGFTTNATPAIGGRWINHVTILAPQNGTTSNTVGPSSGTVLNGALFTPTAGNRLLVVVSGAVTSTTPGGWTKPTNGEAVNSTGMYVWHKVAAGGGDALTTTHNASNYPVVFDFYEFYAGSTFVGGGISAVNVGSGVASPTLSGLTGTNLVMFAADRNITDTAGSGAMTWSVGTEIVDVVVLRPSAGIDGVQYSTAILEDFTGSSTSSAATWTGGINGQNGAEKLAFAINVIQPPSGITGTLTASLPKVTGSVSGSLTTTGTASASIPKITGSISTSVVTGTASASIPKVTSNLFQQTTGTVSGSLPKVTGSIIGSNTGTVSGALPKITSQFRNTPTIAQENANSTGVQGREYWFNYGNDAIPGFARSSYFAPGETARFSVSYSTAYTVQIWRMGWYGGQNARKVAEFAGTPLSQPAATVIPNSNGAVTCSAWSENVTWDIPSDATPGWYWAFMRNAASDAFGGMLFCVTDKLAKKPILVVSSDATWHAAYSGYGGNNVYGASTGVGSIGSRAYCSTYDKPVLTRDNVPQTHFFNGELAQLRFFERFGFEVGYTTCEQINNDPSIMDGRSLIVFSGHNEYISTRIWDKTIEIIAAGTNVANFAANDFFWRVAYGTESGFPAGNTVDSTGRVMWCRKDTMTGPTGSGHTAGTVFTSQADWTGTWQDTRFTGRRPSTDLLGDRFIANGIRSDQVQVPFAMKALPVWRDASGVQALTSGQTWSAGSGTAGMEWDFPDGSLPSVSLSASTVDLTGNSSDINGENYNQNGTYTHAFQMVRNGPAFIFNANTTQWGWALDDLHLRGSSIASTTAVQATLNVLYDLGARGVTALIQSPYVEPTAVSDVAVAYGLPNGVSGTLSGSLPPVTGSLAGTSITTGSFSASLPKLTGSVSGASLTTGSISGVLPKVTSAVSGQSLTVGSVAGSLPAITGSVVDMISGAINGATPKITGSVTGSLLTVGSVAGSLPVVTGSITGDGLVTGIIAGQLPSVSGSISGSVVTTGLTSGSLPAIQGLIIGAISGSLSGSLPRVSGSISGIIVITVTGTIAGQLPRVVGATNAPSIDFTIIAGTPILGTGIISGSSVW